MGERARRAPFSLSPPARCPSSQCRSPCHTERVRRLAAWATSGEAAGRPSSSSARVKVANPKEKKKERTPKKSRSWYAAHAAPTQTTMRGQGSSAMRSSRSRAGEGAGTGGREAAAAEDARGGRRQRPARVAGAGAGAGRARRAAASRPSPGLGGGACRVAGVAVAPGSGRSSVAEAIREEEQKRGVAPCLPVAWPAQTRVGAEEAKVSPFAPRQAHACRLCHARLTRRTKPRPSGIPQTARPRYPRSRAPERDKRATRSPDRRAPAPAPS